MTHAVSSANGQPTTTNGIAVGDVVLYSGGFGEKPYRVTAVEQSGLRVRLVDSTGRPFPVAVGCWDCRVAKPATDPVAVAAAAARPRSRRTVTTCTRRPAAVTKPALPKVVKEYQTTQFRNGRTQRQCWAAATVDGTWRIERQDDVNTVWVIFRTADRAEVPTWFGTLNRALAAIADGYAARSIATQTTTASA